MRSGSTPIRRRGVPDRAVGPRDPGGARRVGQDRTPVLDERGRFTGLYRHVLKVFLVDAAGDVRNVYSAGFLVPEVIINDIKTLLAARREALHSR